MYKKEKIMVFGAVVLLVGIIIFFVGYSQYTGIEGSSTTLIDEAPPGAGATITGMLIMVAGVFIGIYSFGLLSGEPKDQW